MNLSPVLKQRYFDANGLPLAGGLLYSYAAGTSTPQATYSNATGTTNTNPVTLDLSGYADVWLDPNLSYKFVLKDSGGATIFTEDSVSFPFGVAAWNANTVYSQGNVVQDSSGQGLLYVSLTSNNQGNALTNVAAWRVFGGNVRTVSSNQTSPTLLVTDDLVRSNSTAGALTHTFPPCATTPIGKRITVKDVGTGGFTTSVKGSGTDNVDGANTYGTALVSNQSATFENNGTAWDALGVPADKSITTAKLADGSVTQAKRGSLPAVISSSCAGSYSNATTTYSQVTNHSVLLACTGRLVWMQLIPDGNTFPNASWVELDSGSAATAVVTFTRDGAVIAEMPIYSPSPSGLVPCSAYCAIDFPGSGNHTYATLTKIVSGTGTVYVKYCKLYVEEK